ncbi:MAG: metal ABC transporter solute-binding protein, Zn/Mn family [Thermoanaerobaculia bacterium]
MTAIPRARIGRLLCAAALLAFSLGASAAEPLNVYVSLLPMKSFVERVGGADVRVTVMVGPGQSPATYEPSPRQMAGLSTASAYFRIGVPFENVWMERISSARPGLKIVDLRDGIELKPIDSGYPAGATRSASGPGALDPHVWTAPPLVKVMAARIRDTLTDLAPARAAAFADGYRRFAADLDALDAQIRAELAGRKERTFLVFHPSWGYFARAYGLTQIAIEAEGKEPGPRGLATVIDEARRRETRVVFVQKQFSRNDAKTIASAIGGEVVVIDPLAEDFLANTRDVAAAFARNLR